MTSRIYATFGAALADPESNIAKQLKRGAALTRPIKDRVAALVAEGMDGEAAWSYVLKNEVTHGTVGQAS